MALLMSPALLWGPEPDPRSFLRPPLPRRKHTAHSQPPLYEGHPLRGLLSLHHSHLTVPESLQGCLMLLPRGQDPGMCPARLQGAHPQVTAPHTSLSRPPSPLTPHTSYEHILY